jgi:penicillin V acylase-like amidase (Ntn superfamily)
MCTSLSYRDINDNVYFGRTLELSMELPYQLAYFPVGESFQSVIEGHPALRYESRHSVIAVTMPERAPTPEQPLCPNDFKILEGMNSAGLSFSLLAYPADQGLSKAAKMTEAVLSTSDLGSWLLSQFSSVAQAKEALTRQSMLLAKLALLDGAESPFHYVVHDRSGASMVIEFAQGQAKVHDNPVGVMTNGPDFQWHLTNLNNYTFLSNIDQSRTTFGSFQARQPDSGIATAGLPSSNTSVGRFVRATYYAQYTEQVSDPDMAIQTLAHIMNNFDRPRGVTVDASDREGGLNLESMSATDTDTSTEYTSWTSMSDLQRTLFLVRTYHGLNYVAFDLRNLSEARHPIIAPLENFSSLSGDHTQTLLMHQA